MNPPAYVGDPMSRRTYVDATGRTQHAVDGPVGTVLVTRTYAQDDWQVWHSDSHATTVGRYADREQALVRAERAAGVAQ